MSNRSKKLQFLSFGLSLYLDHIPMVLKFYYYYIQRILRKDNKEMFKNMYIIMSSPFLPRADPANKQPVLVSATILGQKINKTVNSEVNIRKLKVYWLAY